MVEKCFGNEICFYFNRSSQRNNCVRIIIGRFFDDAVFMRCAAIYIYVKQMTEFLRKNEKKEI